jgi:hypothetical protein
MEKSDVHVRAVSRRAPRVVPAAQGPFQAGVPGLLFSLRISAAVPIRAIVLLLLLLLLVVVVVVVVVVMPRRLRVRRRVRMSWLIG